MSTETTVNLKKAQAAAQGVERPAKKKKKSKKTKTDAKNREAIKGKLRKSADLMYKYKDQQTGEPIADEAKKAYRSAARKRYDSYQKKIRKEKDPDAKAKLIAKANAWLHKTYNPGVKKDFA